MLQKHPKLNRALKKFAIEYCDNPFKYLYEADVQVLLSKHLESEFKDPHDIIREQNHYPSLDFEKRMNIGKVHREYPAGILLDNVVLGDPHQLTNDQINRKLRYESWYTQPLRYAIELKLVPLYLLPKTKAADDSMDDYQRFVGFVNKNEKGKLTKLTEKGFPSLKYGLQLTLFQSREDQEYFLKNHDLSCRPRYES